MTRRTMQAQRVVAVAATVFGLVTIAAGTRVLLGADPGYVVYRPLLLFNTLMGLAYVLAGLATWKRADAGRAAALAIFFLNLLVLGFVAWRYRTTDTVAVDSVRAMVFRSGVWLVLFTTLVRVARRQPHA